ncbi:MAG TPA: sulfotransferase [Flavobacteriales bacterium]
MSAERFFAIIGAQRSGTTWLYGLLDEHPGITMARPVRPEPKHFLHPHWQEGGREGYLARYFTDAPPRRLLGEKGTSYLEHPEAAARMEAFFPGYRAIAILRHPAARALSNYRFTRAHGLETRTAAGVFLRQEPRPTLDRPVSVSPFDYLERGHYVRYLEPWAAFLGPRLKVVVQEELLADPGRFPELLRWLEVSADFRPEDPHTAVNASAPMQPEEDLPAVLQQLSAYFAPHIAELERWLGRRIDLWHDPIQ